MAKFLYSIVYALIWVYQSLQFFLEKIWRFPYTFITLLWAFFGSLFVWIGQTLYQYLIRKLSGFFGSFSLRTLDISALDNITDAVSYIANIASVSTFVSWVGIWISIIVAGYVLKFFLVGVKWLTRVIP